MKNMTVPASSIHLNAGSRNMFPGTKFKIVKKHHLFRPTNMSVALAKAKIIPDSHLIEELTNIAVLRQRSDRWNIEPSIQLAL